MRLPGDIALLATIALAAASLVCAQTSPSHPRFEVVSVKQNTSPPGLTGVHFSPGGRFTATNIQLRLLIDMAFGVNGSQDHRMPGWIDSDSARYDINAKAEGEATRDEIFAMLRTMLEERFKLQAHREKKEVTVYALKVAKGGPKISEDHSSVCAVINPGDLAPETRQPICGMIAIIPGGIEGLKIGMDGLAGALSNLQELGRKVVDDTGVTARFDVHLRFTPASSDAGGPSIFTALQEQLGIRLESQKGTDDVFVIDHIERPEEN